MDKFPKKKSRYYLAPTDCPSNHTCNIALLHVSMPLLRPWCACIMNRETCMNDVESYCYCHIVGLNGQVKTILIIIATRRKNE